MTRIRNLIISLLGFLGVLAAYGCQATEEVFTKALELEPEKSLKEALERSPQVWEASLKQAMRVHWEFVRKHGTERLEQSSFLQAQTQRVAERLVSVSHYKRLPVRTFVIRDGQLNAYNTGGAYIYVHSGLLNRAGSEDELAFVLGHELGHAMGAHPQRAILPTLTLNLVSLLAQKAFRGKNSKEVIAIVNQYLTTSYSRRHEREADVLGTWYAMRAGYNPQRGAEFFVRAAKEEAQIKQQQEKVLEATYASYASAAQHCEQANRLYQAYSLTVQAEDYFRRAQVSCQRAQIEAQNYDRATQNYVAFIQQLSPIFRTHPLPQERIATLEEVVQWLRGGSARFSSNEAAYAARVIWTLDRMGQKPHT